MTTMTLITVPFIATFIAIGFSSVIALRIRANNAVIMPMVTRDVQILCHEDDADEGTQFEDIVLTISRGNSTTTVPVAAINASEPYKAVGFIDDISVYGFIGQGQASFLLVVWREATFSTSGRYQCKAHKTPMNGRRKEVKSSKAIITERLDKFCSKFNIKNWHGNLGPVNVNRTKNVKSLLHRLGRLIGNQTHLLEARIDKWFQKLDGHLSELFKGKAKRRRGREIKPRQPLIRQWPGGRYGLLQTDEGCPSASNFTWEQGYFKHHTESSMSRKNKDRVSPKNNLAKPVIETTVDNKNFVYTRYCSKKVATTGPAWPRGHYCINRVGNRCPSRFKPGYLIIDNEDDENKEMVWNGPDGHASQIYYCCRDDGAVNRPVGLPRKQSFFLYRFGGKCQAVRGMNVNSQWLVLDTENVRNGDRYRNDQHPDGHAKSGVKIYVCHYRPSQYKRAAPPPVTF